MKRTFPAAQLIFLSARKLFAQFFIRVGIGVFCGLANRKGGLKNPTVRDAEMTIYETLAVLFHTGLFLLCLHYTLYINKTKHCDLKF